MEKDKYIYYKEEDFELYNGKMEDVLNCFEENSIDSIICDPPYELNFMQRKWDNQGIAFKKETWEHCFKVLKEGGYLLAFGGTRTFHRIACAIEDAGFEIRDTIMWLYGSGFPKSIDVGLAIDRHNKVDNRTGDIIKEGKATLGNVYNWCNGKDNTKEYEQRKAQNEWGGFGTCLKPAYEPIIVARKPFKGSLINNLIKNRVGAINIDDCRIGDEKFEILNGEYDNNKNQSCFGNIKRTPKQYFGRFPSNVILTYDEYDYDEVCGEMPKENIKNGNVVRNYEVNRKGLSEENSVFNNKNSGFKPQSKNNSISNYNDGGCASRYFYCAKANKKDRDEGLDDFELKKVNLKENGGTRKENGHSIVENPNIEKRNIHPTVKPVELMQYLVRLVSPKGAIILDCFMGSGSTGKAVMFENRERNSNYKFIGIEMTEQYLPIAKTRIDYAKNKFIYDELKEEKERKEKGIQNIFDLLENE